MTQFYPKEGGPPQLVDERTLTDKNNAVVLYHNPYDNVELMAHHFFKRCLAAKVTPYVVTKKTVFKWQEELWRGMKTVFDRDYKKAFTDAGLLKNCRGELVHFLSDVATMQLVRWSNGGFGMAAHNYDGDVLTDEIAQIHRSPGFLTSVLNGVNDDGTIIQEYEASHGTVTDMWHAHLRGEETSLNPLSLMEALVGAIKHSCSLHPGKYTELADFADRLRNAIHAQMTTPGKASRDLSGPTGLTTEQFADAVRVRLDTHYASRVQRTPIIPVDNKVFDLDLVKAMFMEIDSNKDGKIDVNEFAVGLKKLGLAPVKVDSLRIEDKAAAN